MMLSPEILRRYPCFAGVSDESIKAVAMVSREESFHAGELLFRRGEPADHLYIVTEGEVSICCVIVDGGISTVDTAVRGDLLGLAAVVPPPQLTVTAIAHTDCRVVSIDAPRLLNLCEEDAVLGYRLMKDVLRILSERLEAVRIQLATLPESQSHPSNSHKRSATRTVPVGN